MAAALAAARPARAVDRTFVGSAELDYHFVPTAPGADPNAGATGETPQTMSAFAGITVEASVKLSADVTDRVSANVKMCFGCHGLEADMAYADVRASDELSFRFGRFSPSFGAFNLRHDPANHKLSDNPLPYDMGRMLRKSDWNLGVLPSPFPDNGAEMDGTHRFDELTELAYAVYAIQGFRNTQPNPTDIDFSESHYPYFGFVDDNALPTAGARVSFSRSFGDLVDLTLGASAMGGPYDPHDRLNYVIVGGDATARVARTLLRVEYLARRTDMDTSNPAVFKYAVASTRGNYFVKHGAYVEVEQPLSPSLDAVVRTDLLYRVGNLPETSLLTRATWMLRETAGMAWAVVTNVRLKGSVELWQFRDPDANGQRFDLGVHVSAVASF